MVEIVGSYAAPPCCAFTRQQRYFPEAPLTPTYRPRYVGGKGNPGKGQLHVVRSPKRSFCVYKRQDGTPYVRGSHACLCSEACTAFWRTLAPEVQGGLWLLTLVGQHAPSAAIPSIREHSEAEEPMPPAKRARRDAEGAPTVRMETSVQAGHIAGSAAWSITDVSARPIFFALFEKAWGSEACIRSHPKRRFKIFERPITGTDYIRGQHACLCKPGCKVIWRTTSPAACGEEWELCQTGGAHTTEPITELRGSRRDSSEDPDNDDDGHTDGEDDTGRPAKRVRVGEPEPAAAPSGAPSPAAVSEQPAAVRRANRPASKRSRARPTHSCAASSSLAQAAPSTAMVAPQPVVIAPAVQNCRDSDRSLNITGLTAAEKIEYRTKMGELLELPRYVSPKQFLLLLRVADHQLTPLRTRSLQQLWPAHGVTWVPPHGVKDGGRVLTDIVHRLNARTQSVELSRTTSVDELTLVFEELKADIHSADCEADALIVFDSMRIVQGSAFIPIACQSMLRSILRLSNSEIALSIDGKVQTLGGRWEILSIGFLHRRPFARSTLLKRMQSTTPQSLIGRDKKTRWAVNASRHTTTFAPVMQCICNSESTDIVSQLLQQLLSQLSVLDPNSDWHRRIGMLCRDGSPAIEKARRDVLPFARPLSDFAHFSRHVYSRAKKWNALKRIVHPLYSASMQAPTIELFTAIWQNFHDWLRAVPAYRSFFHYLFSHSLYFGQYSTAQLSKWRCISFYDVSRLTLLWSPVHRGIFTIIPGTGAGEQPVEAFHNGSMAPMSASTMKGAPVTAAVGQLQEAYPKWNATFGWTSLTPLTLHQTPAPSIYRGLHKVGRSSPYDFWHHRFSCNHIIVTHGDTSFVAMHASRRDIADRPPAEKMMTEATKSSTPRVEQRTMEPHQCITEFVKY